MRRVDLWLAPELASSNTDRQALQQASRLQAV